jgi:hypothetical protein
MEVPGMATNKTPPADYLTLALPDQNFAIIPVLM